MATADATEPGAGAALGSGYVVMGLVGLGVLLTYGARGRILGPGRLGVRRAPPWDGGAPTLELNAENAYQPDERAQAVPDGLSQPIRRALGTQIFAVSDVVTMPEPGPIAPARFQSRRSEPAWRLIYAPIVAGLDRASEFTNRLQLLTIRHMLGLMVSALVAMLVVTVVIR